MTPPGISCGFNFSTSKLRIEEVSSSMFTFSKFAGNIWRALKPRFHAISGLRRKSVYMYTAVSTRLSHKSVKPYATMLIGIMGGKSLVLIDSGSR